MGDKAVDQTGDCCFSAAASSAENNTFALLYGQIDIVDTVDIFRSIFISEGNMFQFNHNIPPVKAIIIENNINR